MSNDLVTVATFADPVEANLARNRLEASGVQAFLANEETVDMDWLLGNALGWIRLEVGDQDVDAARAVLSRHDDGLASASDVGPEKVPSAVDEAEPIPEPELEDIPEEKGDDDFEREPTRRDRDAERALRGAILGVLFFPLQFYVFYLLVKVFISEEPLGDLERRRAIIAAVLCLFTLTGVYLFFRGR